MMRIVNHSSVMHDLKWTPDRSICKAPHGTGDQEFFAGRQNPAAESIVANSSQRYGEKLVRSQCIVNLSLPSRLSGAGMEAIRKIPFLFKHK